MLETDAHIFHARCVEAHYAEQTDRTFAGHASVTELEMCRELDAYDAEMNLQYEAEQAAERAARNYDECGQLLWDPEALEDLYRHPYDPQAV